MGELIVNGIKWAFIIAVASIFAIAITTFLGNIIAFVCPAPVTELLGVISNCLPFNVKSVLGSMFSACNIILAFLIAKKIYELAAEHIKV